jgi:hypothetical protein
MVLSNGTVYLMGALALLQSKSSDSQGALVRRTKTFALQKGPVLLKQLGKTDLTLFIDDKTFKKGPH